MEKMENIEKKVEACTKCSLNKDRTNTVPGEGDEEAEIIFIGEAPGRYEDLEGKPFVGKAGEILDELLEDIGLERNEVYIGNILKCRPPKNRDPKKEEIKKCTPFLDEQIQIIDPEIIVPLGNFATKYILEKYNLEKRSIGQIHGEILKINNLKRNITIIPQYHPAATTYNPNMKSDLEKDFQVLKKEFERK